MIGSIAIIFGSVVLFPTFPANVASSSIHYAQIYLQFRGMNWCQVEPVDDGVFDSDVLLTSKQSELLLEQFREEEEADSDTPSNSSVKPKRFAEIFESSKLM